MQNVSARDEMSVVGPIADFLLLAVHAHKADIRLPTQIATLSRDVRRAAQACIAPRGRGNSCVSYRGLPRVQLIYLSASICVFIARDCSSVNLVPAMMPRSWSTDAAYLGLSLPVTS